MEKTRHDSAVKENMLALTKLLKMFDVDTSGRIALYRHTNHRHDSWIRYPDSDYKGYINVESISTDDEMYEFQSALAQILFGKRKVKRSGEDYVLHFIGEAGNLARFIGGYRIKSWSKKGELSKTKSAISAANKGFYNCRKENWYELEEIRSLKELVNRLIVRWSAGPGNLRNRDIDKNVIVQIRPVEDQFPFLGFDQVRLKFNDLVKLASGKARQSWVSHLQKTKGIYLITDTDKGKLYVGSATGPNGFYGRWKDYAKSGHGGNKRIKLGLENLELDRNYFQISILETLGTGTFASREYGLMAEKRWKDKLGRKATALNGN